MELPGKTRSRWSLSACCRFYCACATGSVLHLPEAEPQRLNRPGAGRAGRSSGFWGHREAQGWGARANIGPEAVWLMLAMNLPTLQQVLARLGQVSKPRRAEIRSGHCLSPQLSPCSREASGCISVFSFTPEPGAGINLPTASSAQGLFLCLSASLEANMTQGTGAAQRPPAPSPWAGDPQAGGAGLSCRRVTTGVLAARAASLPRLVPTPSAGL